MERRSGPKAVRGRHEGGQDARIGTAGVRARQGEILRHQQGRGGDRRRRVRRRVGVRVGVGGGDVAVLGVAAAVLCSGELMKLETECS